MLREFRKVLHHHLAPRRHTAVLLAIVALFMVQPLIGDGVFATAAFSVAILMLLLFALYAIQVDELVGERQALLGQRRTRGMIGWALALPAIMDRLALIFVSSPAVYLAGTVLWLLLFIFITWNLLRGVLRQREITSETISMSISVYLLLGFTFGLFYILLHHLQPLAFSLGGPSRGRSGRVFRTEGFPGVHLLQPDYAVDDWFRRHHSGIAAGAVRGGGRRNHGPVLHGDPGRAVGGDADESICKPPGGRSPLRYLRNSATELIMTSSRVRCLTSRYGVPGDLRRDGSRISYFNPCRIALSPTRAVLWTIWTVLWMMGSLAYFAEARAQTPTLVGEEKLIAEFTDPLTTLPQISIKDAFTPANFGTHVQTNQVIVRPIIPRVPRFSLFPFVQLIRPSLSLVTTQSPRGGTRTEFGDMQLLDVAVLPWPPRERAF